MCEQQSLKFWLANDQQTRQAGAALAAAVVALAQSAPLTVFVRGDLGAGKSTLVRGFLSRAGIQGVMPSPTYSLVEPYQKDDLKIYHMDAYRLADAAELDYLGLDDIDAPGSILLVEWPDHIRKALPEPALTVDLSMAASPERRASPPLQSVELAANDVGRLLSVTVSDLPIQAGPIQAGPIQAGPTQLIERIADADEWGGIFRVVT